MYVLAPNAIIEKYPYSIGDLRRDNSQTSFPAKPTDALLAEYNVFPVERTATPEITSAQAVNEGSPELVDRVWRQTWNVRDKTPEELQDDLRNLQYRITDQTQERLDAFARTRNYDGILSACTYATSTVPSFKAEGQYCVNARDATWAALYGVMKEVEAGVRPVPSGYADIEDALPVLEWPT